MVLFSNGAGVSFSPVTRVFFAPGQKVDHHLHQVLRMYRIRVWALQFSPAVYEAPISGVDI
jgi:hypothetical protein